MEKNAHDSSRPKPTPKAATPSRCISSSTTEGEENNENPGTAVPDLLTDEQRELALLLFNKGASPAQVCQQFGVALNAFWETLHSDPAFHAGVLQAIDSLSHNVVSALYKKAMEGNVYAQQFWLKHRPATLWLPPDPEMEPDDFAHLNDLEVAEELAETDSHPAA